MDAQSEPGILRSMLDGACAQEGQINRHGMGLRGGFSSSRVGKRQN